MPRTTGERLFYASLNVFLTVIAFVFYSIFIAGSDDLTEYASLLNTSPVSDAAQAVEILGGIPMLGMITPVWIVCLVEFCCALPLILFVSNPSASKIVEKVTDFRKTPEILMHATFTCTTVGIVCPAMSLIAAFLYYPYQAMPFSMVNLLLNWADLICLNFPLAFFLQLFYVQPLMRTVFRACFRRNERRPKMQQPQPGVATFAEEPSGR